MVNTIYLLSFVETPCKFIIAELSIRKLGSSSVLIMHCVVIIETLRFFAMESVQVCRFKTFRVGVWHLLSLFSLSTYQMCVISVKYEFKRFSAKKASRFQCFCRVSNISHASDLYKPCFELY